MSTLKHNTLKDENAHPLGWVGAEPSVPALTTGMAWQTAADQVKFRTSTATWKRFLDESDATSLSADLTAHKVGGTAQHPEATITTSGFMGSVDKTNLQNVISKALLASLPTSFASEGDLKKATTSHSGLMSKDDKARLDSTSVPATIVVASSTSLGILRTSSDYRCTGTNDHLKIQAALNAIPSAGGRVVLLEGQYNLAATLTLKDYVTLEGQGESTILYMASTSTPILKNEHYTTGVNSNMKVKNIKFNGGSYGIQFQGTYYTTIEDCVFLNGTKSGIFFNTGVTSEYIIIKGNRFAGYLENGISLVCSNSIIQGNISHTNTKSGIEELAGSTFNQYLGNTSNANTQYGILIAGSNSIVSGNTIQFNSFGGITCSGADVNISQNVLYNNGTSGESYSNIVITTGSSYCYLMGNIARSTGNSHYGIKVDTGASYTLIYVNDLHNSGSNSANSFVDDGQNTSNLNNRES